MTPQAKHSGQQKLIVFYVIVLHGGYTRHSMANQIDIQMHRNLAWATCGWIYSFFSIKAHLFIVSGCFDRKGIEEEDRS